MPFERLGEPSSLRLCACGTRGLPKTWEPGLAMHAACGKFNTTHDAPWVDCECGFHAYRQREHAEDHLASFIKNNGDGPALGWAFGRVSLWGRIVEHVDGWRAEYAYPYALTVFGDREIAAKLRGLYGVDIDELPVDQLPRFEDDDDDETSGGIAERLRKVKRQVEELQSALAPPAREVRVPRSVSEAISRRPDGSYRRGEESHTFVESELRQVSLFDKGGPVAASHLAATIMLRLGIEDYQPTSIDAGTLGAILYKLAMQRQARHLRGPGGVSCWASRYNDVPEEYVEQDPTLDYLERDVAMVVALKRAGGVDEEASAKLMVSELSASLGIKQESQRWSGSFVRCQLRGWMWSAGPRTYSLTAYGAAVARHGGELPLWPRSTDLNDVDVVLTALRSAVDDQGDAVTFVELAHRFRCRHAICSSDPFPRGHQVAQRLMSLQRRGLVESERRHGSTLVHWRPSAI